MSLNCNEINLILSELNLEGSFIQEKLVDYSIDKTWFHSICGAEWRDVKGKNQIVYKMLDDFLNNNKVKVFKV